MVVSSPQMHNSSMSNFKVKLFFEDLNLWNANDKDCINVLNLYGGQFNQFLSGLILMWYLPELSYLLLI